MREQVIHRLEAFSDIVIGFSLAQLGLSLVLPRHAVDFVQRPLGLVAFLVTFFVVVRFWWTHFRIFREYFEPNRLMMTFNFIALAGLIVQVFSLQLYLHFVPAGEGATAARIYFAFFTVSYGALGVMFALGLIYRWNALEIAARRTGVRDMLGILGAVAGCALGNIRNSHGTSEVAVAVATHKEVVAVIPDAILLGTFFGWIAGMVAGRLAPKVFRGLRRPQVTAEPRPLA